VPSEPASFRAQFEALFEEHFQRVYRVLDRLTDDGELAADLAQDAFARLYQRGSVPDQPGAWVITVAMNLLRNARSTVSRRGRLLTPARAALAHGEPTLSPMEGAAAGEERRRVRDALDNLPERDRAMLLLMAEGYAYKDIAAALELNEASVGTLLARARSAFRNAYGEAPDAP
jgi:RNA polymerase sigma-70 factor (ECF subfamily)